MGNARHRTSKRELAAKLDLLGQAALDWARAPVGEEGAPADYELHRAAIAYARACDASRLRGAGGDQAPRESSPCPECGGFDPHCAERGNRTT